MQKSNECSTRRTKVKNLAGDENCDTYIKRELERARIDIHGKPRSSGEVPSTLYGKIGHIEFTRAWSYWIARGDVPLDIALKLYEYPVGKTDIRVDGHCMSPPPKSPWVKWFLPDGRRVLSLKERDEYERADRSDSEFIRSITDGWKEKYMFSDVPALLGASGFVELYHIDTEVGLRIFADNVRNIKL